MTDDIPTPTDADAPRDDGYADRTPPHDRDAEMSALGAMMLSRAAVDDVLATVRATDFYLPKHEVVVLAVAAMTDRGDPIDVITVTNELTSTGMLTRAGGAEYLHQLTGFVPTAANAHFYASIVAEKAVLRRLVEAGTRIVQMGYASEGEVTDLVNAAAAELDSIGTAETSKVRRIGEVYASVVNDLETEKPNYIPTPWPSMSRAMGGFAPSNVYLFGAKPGDGKTITILQCAAKLARHGMVAFFSLEMTTEELALRMLSQFGDVHMRDLLNRSLTDQDWNGLAHARTATIEAPIYVDDSETMTIAQIRRRARDIEKRYGRLSGIVIDYAQLLDGEGESRRVVVDGIARGLKQLAKSFKVPVIVAAQLNRPERSRGELAAPTLASLRESGGLEQNADVVLLLHRDAEKHPHDLKVIIAKNRQGPIGKLTLNWEAEFARLSDKPWSPTALIEKEEI